MYPPHALLHDHLDEFVAALAQERRVRTVGEDLIDPFADLGPIVEPFLTQRPAAVVTADAADPVALAVAVTTAAPLLVLDLDGPLPTTATLDEATNQAAPTMVVHVQLQHQHRWTTSEVHITAPHPVTGRYGSHGVDGIVTATVFGFRPHPRGAELATDGTIASRRAHGLAIAGHDDVLAVDMHGRSRRTRAVRLEAIGNALRIGHLTG